MTWQQQLVCRILLIIARMVADEQVSLELKHLHNLIANYREPDPASRPEEGSDV